MRMWGFAKPSVLGAGVVLLGDIRSNNNGVGWSTQGIGAGKTFGGFRLSDIAAAGFEGTQVWTDDQTGLVQCTRGSSTSCNNGDMTAVNTGGNLIAVGFTVPNDGIPVDYYITTFSFGLCASNAGPFAANTMQYSLSLYDSIVSPSTGLVTPSGNAIATVPSTNTVGVAASQGTYVTATLPTTWSVSYNASGPYYFITIQLAGSGGGLLCPASTNANGGKIWQADAWGITGVGGVCSHRIAGPVLRTSFSSVLQCSACGGYRYVRIWSCDCCVCPKGFPVWKRCRPAVQPRHSHHRHRVQREPDHNSVPYAEPESDSNSLIDPERHCDAHADGVADADADPVNDAVGHADVHGVADADADPVCYAVGHAYWDADPVRHADGHADVHGVADADADPVNDAVGHADVHGVADADADPVRYAVGHTYWDADPVRDTDADIIGNADPVTDAICNSIADADADPQSHAVVDAVTLTDGNG